MNVNELANIASELNIQDLPALHGAALVLSGSGSSSGPKIVCTAFARLTE